MGLDVGVEVSGDQVVVVVVGDGGNELHEDVSFSEFALSDGLDDLLEGLGDIVLGSRSAHVVSHVVDFIDLSSKDEDVFFSDFLEDFYVGSVEGSDDETSVHDEFHVGGS